MSNQTRSMLKLASCVAAGVLFAVSMTDRTFAQAASDDDQQPAATPAPTRPSTAQPRPRVAQPSQQPFQRTESPEALIVDLDFPGGTIEEYIAAVHEATGKPFNIITSPEVAAMRLGPVRLRSASSNIVVEAVLTALLDRDERTELRVQHLTGAVSESYGIVLNRLPAMVRQGSPFGRSDRTDYVGTFSIATLVNAPADDPEAKRLPREDVTKAIEAVLKLVASSSPPKILIHPETSLLVVQGAGEHLNLAESVIKQLKEDLAATREADRAVRDRNARDRELEEARLKQQHLLQAEVQRLEQAAQPLRTSLEQLRADPKSESPEVRNEIAIVEEKLRKMMYDRDQIEQQLRGFRLGQFNNSADLNMLSNEVARLRREFEAFKARSIPTPAK